MMPRACGSKRFTRDDTQLVKRPPMGVSADDPKPGTVDHPEEDPALAQAKLPEARQGPGVLQSAVVQVPTVQRFVSGRD
jgi:hypothetical protein